MKWLGLLYGMVGITPRNGNLFLLRCAFDINFRASRITGDTGSNFNGILLPVQTECTIFIAMMRSLLLPLLLFAGGAEAQISLQAIHTDFVLQHQRNVFDTYMREQTIETTFDLPLDSNSDYDYGSACMAASQFMIKNEAVKAGFEKIYRAYPSLEFGTRRAWLEAVYGLYPNDYLNQFKKLLINEAQPKLFCMMAAYIYRAEPSAATKQMLLTRMQQNFPAYITSPILRELKKYLNGFTAKPASMPQVAELFIYQQQLQQKIIYSFQRKNRDYPGMAIIQNPDGSFVRDSSGNLLTIAQLARSASGLPYFITNGNTPQGIYSITGTAVTHNNFIGPTPTIQMLLPFENDFMYWRDEYDSSKDAFTNYLQLLPPSWRNYAPLTEAFYAGKIGRTEIIAHGTTLDPQYFTGQPYYPFSPTLGCLCTKEIWDGVTGRPVSSGQIDLVNAFLSTDGDTGYLMVLQLDDKQEAVSKAELEKLVEEFESK